MTYSLSLIITPSGHHLENKRWINKNDPTSYIPTYISICPRKDGATAKTKCLNPQYNPSSSPLRPLKRKLKVSSSNISAILPKFRVRGSSHHRRPSSLYSSNSSNSTGLDTLVNRSVALQDLPVEILNMVLFYLDYTSVQKLSRTCRKMYSVCHDDNLWRKMLVADFQSVPSSSISQQDDNNSKAVVLRQKKKSTTTTTATIPSCTNLRLYQNHLKLGYRWLTGKVTTRFLQGHRDSVYCLAWISENTLVSGSRDKTIKVWDVKTSSCIRTIENEHDGSILSMRVNRDKTILLTGSSDATCTIWSLPEMVPISKLRGHGHSVLDLCFVGDYVVTSSKDHTLRVWSKETGREVRQLLGHRSSVNAVEPIDDYRVVSASGDTSLKLWNVETGECLQTMRGHRLGLACVRYNGQHLYSGGLDGQIKVWNLETGQCVNTLIGHVGMIRSIDCCEGKIVSGSYDRTLKVWDADTGACILSFQSGHTSWIFDVLLTGTRIVSSGQEKRIMVLDFSSGLHLLSST